MILKIKDSDLVRDLQASFQEKFPYLRLLFFQKPHGREEASFNKYRLPDDTAIRDIRWRHAVDEIEISGTELTAELEQSFEKLFGLHVQVYRKSGAEWVQTVGTDNLSLRAQNLLGKNSSEHVIHPDRTDRIEEREF